MNWKPVVNVSQNERLAAGLIGSMLLAGAFRPLKPLRLFGAACLLYRALSGNCKGYEWLGMSTCTLKSRR